MLKLVEHAVVEQGDYYRLNGGIDILLLNDGHAVVLGPLELDQLRFVSPIWEIETNELPMVIKRLYNWLVLPQFFEQKVPSIMSAAA